MDDHEINLAIAKLEYPETRNLKLWVEQNMVSYTEGWLDIGPIIEREKINISYQDKKLGWCAYFNIFDEHEAYADTPTKAAALCYLKMKGIGNG